MSTSSPLFRRSFKGPKGFTLIELVVVVAIIVLITAAIMVRQARFDSSTLLRSLSYSLALTLRSAQIYGTSVRAVSIGGPAVFAPAYGVYFAGTSNYSLFADLNGNGVYESGVDTIVETYQLGGGFRMAKFCGIHNDNSTHCSTDGASVSWLTVYFKRPNPDALFASSVGEPFKGACVQLAAVNDPANTHTITVSSTGEIAVGAAASVCQ